MGDVRGRPGSEGMLRYFVLTRESISYWETASACEAGQKCRGHVRHKDVTKVEPFGLGFRLFTLHSQRGLELKCKRWQDYVMWLKAWQLCSRYRNGALLHKFKNKTPSSELPSSQELAVELKSAAATVISANFKCWRQMNEFHARKSALQATAVARSTARRVKLLNFRNSGGNDLYPWKRMKATKWDKLKPSDSLKGLSSYFSEKSYGSPEPAGSRQNVSQDAEDSVAGSACQCITEMCKFSDLQSAFKMLDPQGSGVLEIQEARNFFRCLGWVIGEREMDLVLEQVVRSPSKSGARSRMKSRAGSPGKRTRGALGPFTFQQMVQAAELMQATQRNGSAQRLNSIIQATLDVCDLPADHVALDDLEESFGEVLEELGFGEEELQLLAEVLYMDRRPYADRVPCHVMTLRMTDRILHPESVLDGFGNKLARKD